MLVVGLTGGIGSGKTAVSDAFVGLGVPVIDTDVLARELVSPGQPALTEITALFGPDSLNPDGTLNRRYLRCRIFAEPALRQHLEQILHPRIRRGVEQRLASVTAPYAIVVIPLLLETGMTDLVQRILVVDAPESVQLQRVMARDHSDEQQARQIIAAQLNRHDRLAQADDIIDNSGPPSALAAQVTALHRRYQALAGVAPPPPLH